MRSIQFRGKSLKTGKWVFGYYAHRRIKNPTGLYTPNHCIFIPDINYGTDGGYWEEIDPHSRPENWCARHTPQRYLRGRHLARQGRIR